MVYWIHLCLGMASGQCLGVSVGLATTGSCPSVLRQHHDRRHPAHLDGDARYSSARSSARVNGAMHGTTPGPIELLTASLLGAPCQSGSRALGSRSMPHAGAGRTGRVATIGIQSAPGPGAKLRETTRAGGDGTRQAAGAVQGTATRATRSTDGPDQSHRIEAHQDGPDRDAGILNCGDDRVPLDMVSTRATASCLSCPTRDATVTVSLSPLLSLAAFALCWVSFFVFEWRRARKIAGKLGQKRRVP
jgi:hypothetical protein